jgi:hypothetical protein
MPTLWNVWIWIKDKYVLVYYGEDKKRAWKIATKYYVNGFSGYARTIVNGK